MLTLHHLNDSRSQRILWLLEELGLPYEMKRYQRNAETRLAPPELKEVHPLGKSPVITDGDTTIAESAAIVDYIIRRYGQAKDKPAMMPAVGSADYEAYNEWLHYSEGSAMLPLMLNLYVGRLKEAGSPLHPRIDSELANHLGYIDCALAGREFFVGTSLSGGRNGQGVRQAWAVSEPGGLAGAHARPSRVPALDRQGRAVPVCVREEAVIPGRC
jgi:glutathione S-transferase